MKTIGRKFLVLGMIFLFSLILMGVYIGYATIRTSKLIKINEELNLLNYHVEQFLVNTGDFVENAYLDQTFVRTGKAIQLDKAYASLDSANILVASLRKSWYSEVGDNKDLLYKMELSIAHQDQYLRALASFFQQKGFKDLGLEGEMRAAIHNIEQFPSGSDKVLMLTLRRHEKDFLLRKDESYIKKFQTSIDDFKMQIAGAGYSGDEQANLLDYLSKYQSIFLKIVDIENKIGYTKESGLKKSMRQENLAFSELYTDISDEIKEELQQLNSSSYYIVSLLFLMLIFLFGMLIAAIFYYNKYIGNPLSELEIAANEIAKGHLTVNIDPEKASFILVEVFRSFKQIVVKMQTTIVLVENITSRKQKTALQLSSQQDEIGLTLNKVINQLNQLDHEEELRRWESEGIAIFSQLVRNLDSYTAICEKLLPHLIKYIHAKQGGIFLVNLEKQVLQLSAAYAFDRKKILEKELVFGEGLLGQVYFEKELLYLTQLPENYTHITSGLGDALPNSLVIVPCVLNNEVLAIIEIASFNQISEVQQRFLLKVGEILASAIYTVRSSIHANRLVEPVEIY